MSLLDQTRGAAAQGWKMAREQAGASGAVLRNMAGDELLSLTVADDWVSRPITDDAADREAVMELLVMDRDGLGETLRAAEQIEIGQTRYERVGSVAAPGRRLPYAWVIALKPIGSLA